MNKGVLLVDTKLNNINFLIILFKELKKLNYSFFLFSNKKTINNKIKDIDNDIFKKYKNIYFLNIEKKIIKTFIFIILLPFIYIYNFFKIYYFIRIKNIKILILTSLAEKIIYTPIAKIINIDCLWLEYPEVKYKKMNSLILWFYKRNSKKAKLVAFTELKKIELLSLGVNGEIIYIINPGIKLNDYKFQENIFNNLARAKRPEYHKKFFTIGVISDLEEKYNFESLFNAVQKSLSVIPNIQLIIIGDGKERKNLLWLAKKMNIESFVWFVGEQKHHKKWMESFDLFLVLSDNLKIDDFLNVLEAMESSLPIIGPKDFGLDDMVIQNKTGSLIEMNNSEMLTMQIIKIEQEKNTRQRLGELGKERVEKYFTLDIMVEKFKQIL